MRCTNGSLPPATLSAASRAGRPASAHEEFGGRWDLAFETEIDGADAVHLTAVLQDAEQRRRLCLLAAAAVRDHFLRARFRQRRKRIVAERERVSDSLHDFGLRRELLEGGLALAGIRNAFPARALAKLRIGDVAP